MLPHLIELEAPFDASRSRDYDPAELVRYALFASDYWADLAVGWLEQGAPTHDLADALEGLGRDRRRPQALRHRALRLRRSTLGRQ